MSGKRKEPLVTGEIYHAFNRTIAKQIAFFREREFYKALDLVNYYRFHQRIRYSQFFELSNDAKKYYLETMKDVKPLLDIYAFAFMSDHFHFLIKQLEDGGATEFLSNFQNSFAKYFNQRNKRDGSLFKSPFKAKRIETDEQFTHVSRYIHLNPFSSSVVEFENLLTYPKTSLPDYLGKASNDLVNTKPILNFFGNSTNKYLDFLRNHADYQRRLQSIKGLIFE